MTSLNTVLNWRDSDTAEMFWNCDLPPTAI